MNQLLRNKRGDLQRKLKQVVKDIIFEGNRFDLGDLEEKQLNELVHDIAVRIPCVCFLHVFFCTEKNFR